MRIDALSLIFLMNRLNETSTEPAVIKLHSTWCSIFFKRILLPDNKGITVSKFTFGEVYRRLYGRKFSFSGAVKRDLRTYIRRYTSLNENVEYGFPNSNAHLQFHRKLEFCWPYNDAHHPMKCDIINDIKQFHTVYRILQDILSERMTESNQKSCYKTKRISISIT